MGSHQHVSLLVSKQDASRLQTQIVDGLCCALIIFGVVGNLLGLVIFSSCRRTWRISSIYACLATASSITNLLCVIRYALVLHSTLRHFLYEMVGQKWWACKIYEFSFCFRVISSWITLFWMFERLLCVSTSLRTFFNRWNSFRMKFIVPTSFIIILLAFIIGPPVYMYQPQTIDNEISMDTKNNVKKVYCELHRKASIRWKRYFHELHIGFNHFTIRCLFSELIPTGAVILFNGYIICHVIRTWKRLHRMTGQEIYRRQSRTTSWMTQVLLLHSILFLASLLSHVAAHFVADEAHETWWVILAILVNCSLNFYIYCLSGKAFRNEICRFIQRFKVQLYHKLYIPQEHEQRYCQNPILTDEMQNCHVMIRLRSIRLNNLDEEHTT